METSRWLENHFGSESRSSKDSLADDDEEEGKDVKRTSSSFINVTMKSASAPARPGPAKFGSAENILSSRLQPPPPREKDPEPQSNGYFRGVSEWKTRTPTPTQHNQER